jgi:hypothetical protein
LQGFAGSERQKQQLDWGMVTAGYSPQQSEGAGLSLSGHCQGQYRGYWADG